MYTCIIYICTHHCKPQVGLDLACWLPALGVLVTASDKEQGQLPPADLPGALLLSSCLGWVLGGLSRGACGMGSGQVGTPQALTCSPPFF